MSNCFSINQLVRQNIILLKQTGTSAKCDFSAIVLNMKIDSFATSCLVSSSANEKVGFVISALNEQNVGVRQITRLKHSVHAMVCNAFLNN